MTDELYSGFWLDVYDNTYPEKVYQDTFPLVKALILKYKPDARVILELACGTGRYTKYFVNAGFAVKGTDISADAVARAQKRVPKADFEVIDMARINARESYDAVVCLHESFRYNPSYAVCEDTLFRVWKALKPNGVFACDFGFWPPAKESRLLNEIDMGKGLVVKQETVIVTKGKYDTRVDTMTFMQGGKAEKQQTIERAPLLRISRDKMVSMLSKIGFKVCDVVQPFRASPQSMLFVAQKLAK